MGAGTSTIRSSTVGVGMAEAGGSSLPVGGCGEAAGALWQATPIRATTKAATRIMKVFPFIVLSRRNYLCKYLDEIGRRFVPGRC